MKKFGKLEKKSDNMLTDGNEIVKHTHEVERAISHTLGKVDYLLQMSYQHQQKLLIL